MRLSFKRPSLSINYFILSTVLMLLVVGGSLWFGYSVYKSQIQDRNHQCEIEADRLASKVRQSLDYISNLAQFIGKRIVENDSSDLRYIASIFRNKFTAKVKEQDAFLWSIFGWVDLNDDVVVTNREGILTSPTHVSSREYLKRAPESPWKLHLDDPSIGLTSWEYVIPGGMGITDKKGEYIGAVTMGLNIFRLTNLLEQAVSTSGVSFLLVTRDFRLVSQPSNNQVELRGGFLKDKLGYLASNLTRESGALKQPLTYGDVTYKYYRLISPYPYILLVGEDTYVSQREFREKVVPFITPMIIMGMFFLILLFFFRKKIVNPMIALSNAAIEIANSNYDAKIPNGNSFESYNLAKALLRIKRSFHKERQLKNALQDAITEAHAAREEAVRANKAKTEFLSNMSHELRTPLNATIGFSEMMLSGVFGELSAKNKEYAHDIQASGKHLLHLITDLLDINKAESGKFELREEEADIREIINESLKFIRTRAEEKLLKIQSSLPSDLPRLYCDPLRMKQVMVNLLSNAVKYTPDGGTITINVDASLQAFNVSITDTGIGIADVEKALEVFGTIDNDNNRNGESTGLGLPLAKKLIELHQAHFVIESKLGEGTKITMIFPKSRIVQKEVHYQAHI